MIWNCWTDCFFITLTPLPAEVNLRYRYRYVEPRLFCLNWIYRLCYGMWSITTVVRGYMSGYIGIRRFCGAILVAVGDVCVHNNCADGDASGTGDGPSRPRPSIQDTSYGYTVFSILTLLIGIVAMVGIVLGLFVLATVAFKKKVETRKG